MRRITGAILRDTVPAMIMRSACRGDARNTPAPNRSKSYRDDTVAIISMAQQARPKVIGHKADLRDQFTTASRLVVRIFASNCRSGKLICSYFPLSSRIDWDGWPGWLLLRASSEHILIVRALRAEESTRLPVHPSPILVPFERPLLPGIPKSGQ